MSFKTSLGGLRFFPSLLRNLGLQNVLAVLRYRLACRSGWLRRCTPIAKSGDTGLLRNRLLQPDSANRTRYGDEGLARQQRDGYVRYFSHGIQRTGSPPDWFYDPYSGVRYPHTEVHWSRIDEFRLPDVDIKAVWELSRFEWLVHFAQAFRLSGDERYIDTANRWLDDWVARNPANQGPNWKCGQETSFRLLNALLSVLILGQSKSPTEGFQRFIRAHCQRVAPTLYYAIAQDNNHGTSEAAALFIGGAWLKAVSHEPGDQRQGTKWAELGRYWLEDRVRRLITADGSFSQHSVNYHRVALDTLSLVEVWRRFLGEPIFSDVCVQRYGRLFEWLVQLTDTDSGQAPNLGGNDGTRLIPVANVSYGDNRPSLQLASVLLRNKRLFPEGPWNEVLHWCELASVVLVEPIDRASTIFPQGGYVSIHSKERRSWALLRTPRSFFRPAQSDALHMDLWCEGRPLLHDSGTFSYHAPESASRIFGGTCGHNTVEFDSRDQMPRVGRFLYAKWLDSGGNEEVLLSKGCVRWQASYRDYWRCKHQRTVVLEKGRWIIRDELEGPYRMAILRWHLDEDEWTLEGTVVRGPRASLSISSDGSIAFIRLVSGWQSTHYLQRTVVPVLEVAVQRVPARLTTEINLGVSE